jgi:hypothetical protein
MSKSLKSYSLGRLHFQVLGMGFILMSCLIAPGKCSAQQVVDRMVCTVNAGIRTDLITYSDLLWQLALQPKHSFGQSHLH